MVLVSRTHNLVFLKTQKTAGTSTEMFLQSYVCADGKGPGERTHAVETETVVIGARLIPIEEFRPLDVTWHEHMSATNVRTALGDRLWHACLKITNIRNPFDLVVSQFLYRLKRLGKQTPPDPRDLINAFRRWITKDRADASHAIVHDGTRRVPDIYLRYEYLTEDLKALCARLGWPFERARLPRTKPTRDARNGLAVREFHNAQTATLVRERFAWMFEAGNYSGEIA